MKITDEQLADAEKQANEWLAALAKRQQQRQQQQQQKQKPKR